MSGQEPRVQPPALEAYSDLPLFNTKAVVHQTGVPAPTLRAWERRYGILTPRRGENDYRLYSERDIVTVTWLRERVQAGMTISQAIALLKSLEPPRRRGRRAHHAPPAETRGTEPSNGHGAMMLPPPAEIPRFSLAEMHATLLHQFARLDEFAARRTIAQSLAVYPVEEVCLQLLTPVLYEIGERWAAGEVSVSVEHFSAGLIRTQLGSLFRSASGPEDGALVLVGCAPNELHELGSLMLALFLRRAGVHVAYLGQSIEIESLLETAERLSPAAILLSVSMREHAGALIEIGERLAAGRGQHPLFGFGGRAFTCDAALATQIPGLFLGADVLEAVRDVRKRLSA